MKGVLLGIGAALVALSVVVVTTQPELTKRGQKPIVWVTDDNPLRQEQMRLFEKLNPGYDLRIDPANGTLEKVVVQSLAGVGPDCFDYFGEADLNAYVRAGILWDITDELKARGIDITKEMWPMGLPTSMLEGRVYGLGSNANVDGIWYFRDAFRRAGVPEPKGSWTVDEFVRVAEKLTKRDPKTGKTTFFGCYVDIGAWQFYLPTFGGEIYNETGTLCTLDRPEAIACLQWMHDLMYKYKVSPNPVEMAGMATAGGWGQFQGGLAYLLNQRVAMAMGGRWWLARLREQPGLDLYVTEPPIAKFKRFQGGIRNTGINRHSPRRENALKFLLYLASPEYNRLVNDQADALAPFKRFSYEPGYLNNPKYPKETYNEIWRRITEWGVRMRVSPFITQREADRIIGVQIDLIKANQKPVPDAMRDAAKNVNAAIRRNVLRTPGMKEAFLAAGGTL